MIVKNAMYYAKQVIGYCNSKGCLISNLQLQKILYFLQMQNFRFEKNALFDDEFLAYPYGPIIYDVYTIYSRFAANYIQDDILETIELKDIQKRLIDNCVNMSPWRLVDISHKQGGAWDKTYANKDGIGRVISKDLIFEDSIKD